MRRLLLLIVACVLVVAPVHPSPQGNGTFQLHFMNVGQGDAAVLISPGGEVVLFDDGVQNHCDKPLSYLDQLGIDHIDYHIASHYHSDHIGCAAEVLSAFPLRGDALDRGSTYTGVFQAYVTAVGAHRKTATQNMVLTVDQGSPTPVTIQIVALNGNGIKTTNENDLSVDAVVHYGNLDIEMGGDLSGVKSGDYEDIESSVAPLVGEIEVYKVHHHGSRYSSNDTWLRTTRPTVGIISADDSTYHHPTIECLSRLHAAGVKTYWTNASNGAVPVQGLDVVGGNIIVEARPGATTFTVLHNGGVADTYPMKATAPRTASATGPFRYAWSKKSQVYHDASCSYVANISPDNLVRGNEPPEGKKPHTCVKKK